MCVDVYMYHINIILILLLLSTCAYWDTIVRKFVLKCEVHMCLLGYYSEEYVLKCEVHVCLLGYYSEEVCA